MKRIGAVALILLLTIACSSGKLTTKDTVSENETIIIGKFTIQNNGKDITKNAKIYFDENSKGVLSYRLDESGLFIMKIPKGNHFLKLIYTSYGSANLPDAYANLQLNSSEKVHYIGNIEINGTGVLQKKFRGIVQDVQAKDLKERKIPITVTDNPKEATEIYQQEFGKQKAIVTQLLEISE